MIIKLAGMFFMVFVSVSICGQRSFAEKPVKQQDWSVAEKLFEAKCKLCHKLDRVKNTKKTPEEWQSTVTRMKSYAPVLTNKEAKLIVDYLSHHYGRQ
jgi:cytochrome c2